MPYKNHQQLLEYRRQWRAKNRIRLLIKAQQWRDANRDKIRQYSRNYYYQNTEKRRESNRHSMHKRSQESPEQYRTIRQRSYWKNINQNRQKLRDRYHNIRSQLMKVLGGVRCKQCGFSDTRALQIDHVFGGGTKEIKKLGNFRLYKFYLSNPKLAKEKLQVLCANCNAIKRREKETKHKPTNLIYKKDPDAR